MGPSWGVTERGGRLLPGFARVPEQHVSLAGSHQSRSSFPEVYRIVRMYPNEPLEARTRILELWRVGWLPHIGQDLGRKHMALSKGTTEGGLKKSSS